MRTSPSQHKTSGLRYWAYLSLLLTLLLCGACLDPQNLGLPDVAASAPPTLSRTGDASRGRQIFIAEQCPMCHTITQDKLVGPGLAGLFSEHGPTLPVGIDYRGMLPNGRPRTDEHVSDWIRVGGSGKIGFMLGHSLTDAEMADLLAYLRTLK